MPVVCMQQSHAFSRRGPRASDFFFQDLWAEVTHEQNSGSFSEMMGPSISY